jgi:NAD-dependent dihydropyrimidine dehydrogenase PreA subunit
MKKDVYERLARHLDDLPGGYPRTESGVELRILRRLFAPEEAELALKLSLIPQAAGVIARKAGLSSEEAASRLEELAKKGLIYRLESPSGPPNYMAIQFAIGIWEFHVNDLSPELIRDFEEYLPTLLNLEIWKKAPQLRTVPVGRSIPVTIEILAHENAEAMVRKQTKWLVAPCICRRERKMVGEGCSRLEEACLVFGRGVDFYERNGLGRKIGMEEALTILRRADEEGLILQPSNSQKIANICCCCGCCCGVLRTIKLHPKPASIVSSAFTASADPELCTGCETCLSRCQMGAIRIEQEKSIVDSARCIGCGLCVSTCPTGSLRLIRKAAKELPEVPRTQFEAYRNLGLVRGKLGAARQAKIVLQAASDRLRARK